MCVVVPPTAFLPPLKRLKTCSEKEIAHALAALRHIYIPEVRGSRRRRDGARWGHRHPAPGAGGDARRLEDGSDATTAWKDGDDCLTAIRADTFEQRFAIQWLTRFVALFSDVGTSDNDDELCADIGVQTLEDAASLLAICAGTAASGAVTRTLTLSCSYPCTLSSPTSTPSSRPTTDPNEIRVILRDAPLESSDASSVGAQTWGGSCILAEMIAGAPHHFSIFPRTHVVVHEPGAPQPHPRTSPAPFRALELGAGTGLASVVLGKVLARIRGARPRLQNRAVHDDDDVDDDLVVATDVHPSVLANLRLNLAVNFPPLQQQHARDADVYADDKGKRETSLPQQRIESGTGPRMVDMLLDWSAVHASAGSARAVVGSALARTPFRGYRNEVGQEQEQDSEGLTGTGRRVTASRWWSDGGDADAERQREPTPQARAAHHHADLALPCEDSPARPMGPSVSAGAPVTEAVATETLAPWLDGAFDLIIGADIIYEGAHARRVRACVERFLRRPAVGEPVLEPVLGPVVESAFHLVIPLRRTHGLETRSVEEVFGGGTGGGGLGILGWEDIVCDAYRDDRGGGEEVVYRYYRIGWVRVD